ncbi:hypothetical protein IQ254_28925 [Nodosilinea sp. LEGE 07088]|uniref:hypothetical protein n=1 Tax=Nodosilinea sp. LEGE 07088 TaxID=2777968 RepID=UPI0018817E77|nr:hypothetical protein [Nodosilinea sp. LEGE 07088]MBE9141178.1 hypothetical protein [Nodosilinea sp. LEGE 07088]
MGAVLAIATMPNNALPLHTLNPLGRFSDRAADYARYRPSYPEGAIAAMLADRGDPRSLVVADIGAGTGISSRLLADWGPRVTAWHRVWAAIDGMVILQYVTNLYLSEKVGSSV